MELLAQCYTNVLNSMADYTASLEADNKLEAMEEDMAVVEKLSVILKRIGETQVVELVEQDLDNTTNEEVGDEEI
jgi:hypothetical protein